MAISFVATAYTEENSSDTSYVLTKPTGVQSGDVMLAFLCLNLGEGGSQLSVTPPTGWTTVRTSYNADGGGFPSQITVMKRQAGGSEPSSWTGSIASSKDIKLMCVSAYRGADINLIGDGATGTASDANYSTATVNNTDSGGWSVAAATYNSINANAWSISGLTERQDDNHTNGSDVIAFVLADSNAAMTTGNKSYTVNKPSGGYDSSASWHGILAPASEAATEADAGSASVDGDAYNATTQKASSPSAGTAEPDVTASDADSDADTLPDDSPAVADAYDAGTLLASAPGAESAEVQGVAHGATADLASSPDAGTAEGSVAAHDATVSTAAGVNANAGAVAGDAFAYGPSVASGTESGTGEPAVTAHDATVTTSSETNAPAGGAAATVDVQNPVQSLGALPDTAEPSVTAHDAAVDTSNSADPDVADVSVVSHDASVAIGTVATRAVVVGQALVAEGDPSGVEHAAAFAVAHDAGVDAVQPEGAPRERTFTVPVSTERRYLRS